MTVLAWLIPVSFCLGVAGLASFLWALRTGQYEDLRGAGERILIDDGDSPVTGTGNSSGAASPRL